MTASVGNAPPRGVDSLLQSGSAKIPGAGFRRHAVHQEEANAQSEDVNQNVSSTELDASRSRVDHAGKVSKREPGKEGADNDDDSFEDTFKSMGEDAPKDVSSNVTTAPSYPAGLLLAQATGNIPVGNPDPAQSVAETSTAVARPTPLLKQKNILALMDTKDRISTNQDTDKTDDTNLGQVAPEHSEGVADAIPLTVDRQEAHWNFNNDVISSAASNVSALQTGAQLAPKVLKQALSDSASPVQPSEVKTSNSAPRDLTPQAVVMPDSGQSANTALSGGGNGAAGDSQLQNGAALPTESGSKPARAEASSSIDQLLGVAAASSQSQQSVTTQVRDGVVNSLATNASDPSANSAATPNRPATAPVLRTLDLTLSPPDLGSVKLRLSLKSNSLSIEAEASKASTAKLLSDDRTNLERGLRDAGYDVSSMKITDTSASNSSNTGGWQQGSTQTRDGEQARSAFGSRQEGEMQRRDGSTSDQSQRRQRQENPQQAIEPANSRPSSAVYI